jgi:glutamate/tyrosine decarboxylase-like PLP-dependent enzyme
LFQNPDVGRFYKHDSPFTYFSSAELHLGEISLECSRPGASAVALWATQQLFPLVQGGEFAASLDKSLQAARNFHARLEASEFFVPLMEPELDIVVYATAAPDASASSERTRRIFERAAEHDLHLAMIELPVALVQRYASALEANADTITCLRSVLMKPEHGEWLDAIMEILERSAKI